jgi:hypothetical protein
MYLNNVSDTEKVYSDEGIDLPITKGNNIFVSYWVNHSGPQTLNVWTFGGTSIYTTREYLTSLYADNEIGVKSLIFESQEENKGIFFGSTSANTYQAYLTEVYMIDTKYFDENITKEKLDLLLTEYKTIRNNVIEPEVFLITEPIGLGKRYRMLTVNDRIYGHELDFEQIGFKVNFGINYHAYDGYNLLIEFISDNEAIIEYDWGKGSRYGDVRLQRAPKTEKNTLSLIISKFSWNLLNPFYLKKEVDAGEYFENTHSQAITPVVKFTTSNTSPALELELEGGGLEQEIRFDFTGVTLPVTVIVDSENKTIKFEDGSNAYDYVDKAYSTFFSIEEGNTYEIVESNCTINKIEYKQWVVD